jgi:EpsI family protein
VTGSTLRFILAAVLVAAAAVFLQAHSRNEIYPPRQALKTFPAQLGDWVGADLSIDDETLQILGPGDFLLRSYEKQQQPSVNLFLAYFPTQRAGDTIHSPKNCLPGAGWSPVESARITLSSPGHIPFTANRYVIARGESRELVLYWYWAHDRGVASEYWAKYYEVADSLKMNRSDGALVRINSAMGAGETPEAAEQRLLPFANQIVPLLNDYVPR